MRNDGVAKPPRLSHATRRRSDGRIDGVEAPLRRHRRDPGTFELNEDAEAAPCSPRIAFLLRPVSAPYMRSLSRQLLMIGTQSASNSCKASQAVSMARESHDLRGASKIEKETTPGVVC